MGFQHGRLLAQAIRRGPVPYFRDYLPRMLSTGLGPGAQTAARLLQATVGRELIARFPAHLRVHLEALAAGAGLPLADFLRAFVLPDQFLWLVSLANRARRPGVAPTLGCSSALALATRTAGEGLLHGRNLDYMGVGYWDAEPAILFYTPEQGQPYVSLSAAGIPFGGITAMNAAGLTLAVHQHLSCLNLKRGGVPIGIAGDAVMRRAESLAEAVRLLDDHPPTACWTYLIASAREQAVLVYETGGSATRWFISRQPTLGYTNFYLDPELAAAETHFYPSQWRSNLGRYQTLQQRLGQPQNLSAQDLAGLLGDAGGACRLAQPLAMLYTVSSAVMAPGRGLLYAAAGPAPVSRGHYWAFDLATGAPREDLAPLGPATEDAAEAEAFAAYRRAYQSWFETGDSRAALQALELAATARPREALFAYMAALLALDLRLPDQAVHWLNKALGIGHAHAPRTAAFHLWRGRAHDLAGLRTAARQDYAAALAASPDPRVATGARAGRRSPWRWRRLALDFNYADAL